MANLKKKDFIGVLDFETDPFKRGRIPKPFIAGLYTSHENDRRHYKPYYEADVNKPMKESMRELIRDLSKYYGYVYAHNGGRFDFIFIVEELGRMRIKIKELKMIRNRIAKLSFGQVTLVDSYLLLPTPLKATGEKLDFEYWKTERSLDDLTIEELEIFDIDKESLDIINEKSPRRFYIEETKTYLKQDCVGAFDVITEFIKLYGFGLTLAGRAFAEIEKTGYKTPKNRANSYSGTYETYAESDQYFRKFFFGGRVQCFQKGKIEGNLYYYDINSAYPFAMTKQHWYGDCDMHMNIDIENFDKMPIGLKRASFYIIDAKSFGAFPVRKKSGGIEFPEREGEFNVTGWELTTAIELDIIENLKIKKIIAPLYTNDFGTFVRRVHKRKQKAGEQKNAVQRLIHKLVLNSGYGRLAIDPTDWKDHLAVKSGENPIEEALAILEIKYKNISDKDDLIKYEAERKKIIEANKWELSLIMEELNIDIWEKPTAEAKQMFHSVCTAASITGFVRSMILRAIAATDQPLYCDTDSMVCKGEAKLDFGDALGKWECEAKGNEMHIAAKKIYAFKEDSGKWKTASKGVKFSHEEIIRAARGERVTWRNIAPSFGLLKYTGLKQMEEMTKDPESDDFRKVFIERSIEDAELYNEQEDEKN